MLVLRHIGFFTISQFLYKLNGFLKYYNSKMIIHIANNLNIVEKVILKTCRSHWHIMNFKFCNKLVVFFLILKLTE